MNGRPCKLDTKRLDRTLNDAERQIILTAGEGDLSRGWHKLLELYAHVHSQGYRPDQGFESVSYSGKSV